jgi:ribosomal protein L37E
MEAVYQEIGSSKVPPPFTQAKRELERQEAEKRRYNGNGNGHAPAREPSKLHIRCGGCGKSNWVRRAGEMNKCRNCGYVPAQRSDDMGQLVPARIQKISKDGIVLADQDAPTRYVVALK